MMPGLISFNSCGVQLQVCNRTFVTLKSNHLISERREFILLGHIAICYEVTLVKHNEKDGLREEILARPIWKLAN